VHSRILRFGIDFFLRYWSVATYFASMNLRPRWYFFSGFCVQACIGRFISLFLEDIGFSDSEIGILLMVYTFAGMLGCSVMGYAADKLLGYGCVLTICAVGNCLAFTLYLLPFQQYPQSFRLIVMIVVAILHNFFARPLMPLLDALCLEHFKNIDETGKTTEQIKAIQEKRKEQYGTERLWGAVGWGVTNLALGFLLDKFGFTSMVVSLYITTFLFLAVLKISNLLSCQLGKGVTYSAIGTPESVEMINVECESKTANVEAEKEDTIHKEDQKVTAFFHALFLDLSNSVFMFSMVVLAAGVQLVEGLVFLYFKDTLNASYALCGVSVVITVSFEIPIFAVAQRLIDLLGKDWLVIIGLSAYFTRVAGYTLIDESNQWLILIWEPLHGVTYATTKMALVLFSSSIAPPGYEASTQAFVSNIRSLGLAFGAVMGGRSMEEFGSKNTYRGASLIVIATTLLYALTCKTCRRKFCSRKTTDVAPAVDLLEAKGLVETRMEAL